MIESLLSRTSRGFPCPPLNVGGVVAGRTGESNSAVLFGVGGVWMMCGMAGLACGARIRGCCSAVSSSDMDSTVGNSDTTRPPRSYLPRESSCGEGGDKLMMGDVSSKSEPKIPGRESSMRGVFRVCDRNFELLLSRSCSLPLRDFPKRLRLETLVFELDLVPI